MCSVWAHINLTPNFSLAEPNTLIKYMKSSASKSAKIGIAQPFFPLGTAGNLAFEMALIQTPNLSCAEPNA